METSLSNNWVESYLDALLSFGLSTEYSKSVQPSAEIDKVANADHQAYAKYYVNQILQLDEEGIRGAWNKATSSRQYGEKDVRLEYLSWRVWGMKRKKARVTREKLTGNDLADQLSTETDSRDASSDDESVSTSPRPLATSDTTGELVPPVSSFAGVSEATGDVSNRSRRVRFAEAWTQQEEQEVAQVDLFQPRMEGLYVILISLHGLVRGERMELGRDPDTGGQVKYVVELAKTLAILPGVFRVELLTRQILDPTVDSSYGEPEECLVQGDSDMAGAYIVRLPCGPSEVYLRKEMLWPYVREFADQAIVHSRQMLSKLKETGHPCELYAVHGHYADAGEAAALIASTLNVDMFLTGHSLGRNKLEHLRASGTMTRAEIEESYKISRRIEGEERALDSAMIVFTSTAQEVDEQWGLYDGYDALPGGLASTLRARPQPGRAMPLMRVIPPGLDFSSLKVDLPEDPVLKQLKLQCALLGGCTPHSSVPNLQALVTNISVSPSDPCSPRSLPTTPKEDGEGPRHSDIARGGQMHEDPRIWQEVFRFLRNPRKPVILAMSRPDAKKNITTLVKAFAGNKMLRELANLVLIMGNRDNIDGMVSGSAKVLTQVLKMIDAFDLYGSVAYPKHHTQAEISDIYGLAFKTKGVFTNVALQEPFGLTVIEAAAHGVPTVATRNGGPVDIMATLFHGVVVDPTSPDQIADKLVHILTNPSVWEEMSSNGIKNIMAYSWPSHCMKVLETAEREKKRKHLQWKKIGNFSGSWDAETLNLASMTRSTFSAGMESIPPISLTNGIMVDRANSCPNGDSLGVLEPESSTVSHQLSGMSNDDLGILEHTMSTDAAGAGPEAARREKYIIVQLDGTFMAAHAVHTLESLIDRAADTGVKDCIGFGLASMLGFEDTIQCLKGLEFVVDQLDFIICNSGADIWHKHHTWQGSVWQADSQYEEHIEFRWSRLQLSRMLGKWIPNPTKKFLGLNALMSYLPEEEKGQHPHHMTMPLDAGTRARLLLSVQSTKKDIPMQLQGGACPPTVLLDRIKRRLRKTGYRVNLTLQMIPKAGAVLPMIHFTPLRASRPLALRYLVHKFGKSMANVDMSLIARKIKPGEDGNVLLSGFTSDFPDLVAGMHKVWVVSPELKEMYRTFSSEYGSLNNSVKQAVEMDDDMMEPIERVNVTVIPHDRKRVHVIEKLGGIVDVVL